MCSRGYGDGRDISPLLCLPNVMTGNTVTDASVSNKEGRTSEKTVKKSGDPSLSLVERSESVNLEAGAAGARVEADGDRCQSPPHHHLIQVRTMRDDTQSRKHATQQSTSRTRRTVLLLLSIVVLAPALCVSVPLTVYLCLPVFDI